MKHLGLATLFLVVGVLPRTAHAMPPGEEGARLRAAAHAVDEVRIADAEALLGPIAAAHPNDPEVIFERGVLRYVRGEYAGAADDIVATAIRATALRSPEERGMLLRIALSTRDVTSRFEELRSDDDRLRIRFAPGLDRVVAVYALDVMRAVDDALTEELGVRHPGPIRLEIYPTTATLADVSTLTVEEIETTGTIALCKWDRLMITSPRALVRGYPWADTIGHELVHLVVSYATHDRAPVWMQEGFARFLERRWRGGAPVAALDPGSERSLRVALETEHLLAFDRLHPSIAMLPTAEDAALAFAQVSTFVEAFYGRRGPAGLSDVLTRVGAGTDAREAFALAAGATWDELEVTWREALLRRPVADADAEIPILRFRHGDAEPDDTDEIDESRARRAVRLGDLLWEHDRFGGAAFEYGRAHDEAPDDPIVSTRLGRAALQAGAPEQTIAALEPLRARYGEYEPLLSMLGAAYAARGDLEHGREASLEAIRVNPYDPEPHCTLADVAATETERARAAEHCTLLGASR